VQTGGSAVRLSIVRQVQAQPVSLAAVVSMAAAVSRSLGPELSPAAAPDAGAGMRDGPDRSPTTQPAHLLVQPARQRAEHALRKPAAQPEAPTTTSCGDAAQTLPVAARASAGEQSDQEPGTPRQRPPHPPQLVTSPMACFYSAIDPLPLRQSCRSEVAA